jgi:hypothetical protein
MTVVVECPRCHRPVCRLSWSDDHADVLGTVYAENGDPGGTLNTYQGGRVPKWATRVIFTEPDAPPGSSSSIGRKTIRHVCAHRRVQTQPVTQAALTATYRRAVAAGRNRVSLLDLRE